MFIIIVFRLGSGKLVCCLCSCLSQGISHGMWFRLGEGRRFLIFDCSSPFRFLLINFIIFSPSRWHVMFIIIVCDSDFIVLSQGISHWMWLLAWERGIFIKATIITTL